MPRSANPSHRRSILACMKCHRAKIKCDIVTHGNPCSKCKSKGQKECELYPSKRLHGRENMVPAKTGRREPSSPIADMTKRQNSNYLRASPSSSQAARGITIDVDQDTSSIDRSLVSQRNNSSKNDPAQHFEASPASQRDSTSPEGWPLETPLECTVEQEIDSKSPRSEPQRPESAPRKSRPLEGFNVDEIAETERTLADPLSGNPPSPTMLLSWLNTGNEGEMMRALLEKSQANGGNIDKDTLVFVGESSPLSFLVRRLRDSGHVAMSNISQLKVQKKPSSTQSSSISSVPSNAESAVGSLDPGILEDLIRAYFAVVHPFYPVVNRRWFAEKYRQKEVPQLLLNSVCFAACYHCDAPVIFKAGYSSRDAAKENFYMEAKRLFDEENEDDILIILQSAVLLSFYGGKPRSVWNNRSWIAIAVTIAEDLGLHRSTCQLKMNAIDKSHLRIIWWCIVQRDFMTSLNFGRPQKTCDSRSDFELLSLDEFEGDIDPENPIFGKKDISNCHFLVENAKLNMLMMKVFNSRYSPHSDPQPNLNELYQEVLQWRRNLPACLNWELHPSSLAAIYTCMVYHHMVIFIFRPRMIDSEIVEMCSLKNAVESANEIASLVGRLGVIGTCKIPQDLYSVIVTAVAILMNNVQANNSAISKLQLQICFMTLNQAKENWDHAPWVVKLFDNLQDSASSSSHPDFTTGESAIPDDMDFLNTAFIPL